MSAINAGCKFETKDFEEINKCNDKTEIKGIITDKILNSSQNITEKTPKVESANGLAAKFLEVLQLHEKDNKKLNIDEKLFDRVLNKLFFMKLGNYSHKIWELN